MSHPVSYKGGYSTLYHLHPASSGNVDWDIIDALFDIHHIVFSLIEMKNRLAAFTSDYSVLMQDLIEYIFGGLVVSLPVHRGVGKVVQGRDVGMSGCRDIPDPQPSCSS